MAEYINCGINENTYNFLTTKRIRLNESEYGKLENGLKIRLIEDYSIKKDNSVVVDIFGKEVSGIYFIYDEDTNEHTLVTGDEKLSFKLISESQDLIKKLNKEELESDLRLHHCHLHTLTISSVIENAKSLIGYIKIGKNQYLHSVTEFNENGVPKIIDYTRNIIIDKDLYTALFEFNIISEIPQKKLIEDFQILESYGLLYIKTIYYLVFRNEIMKDIEKNTKILNKKI